MKKIYNSLFLGLLAMVFAVSCNPEEDFETVTLHAGFDQPKVWLDPTTGNGALPKWHDLDAININGVTHYIEVNEQDATRGDIKGVHVNQTYKAVFPATAWGGDTSSTTVSAKISSTQQYEVDETGKQIVKAPMVAIADRTGNLYFKNTCALIKVVATPQANEHVTAIKVQKVNAQSLTGKVTYTKNNDNETFTYTPNQLNDNSATTVTLTGIQDRADNTYYVYVPFESTSTGSKYAIQVEVTTGGSTKYYNAITPNDITLQRNKIYTVNATLGENPFDNIYYFSVSTTKKVVFNSGNYADQPGQFVENQLSLETSQYLRSNQVNAIVAAQPEEWKLLTSTEWTYLIARTLPDTSTKLYKAGTFRVNGTDYRGILLFPDNIEASIINNFPTANNNNRYTLSESDWQFYDAHGAVFMRNALSGSNFTDYCQLWCGLASNPRQVDASKVVKRTGTNNRDLTVGSGDGWNNGSTVYAGIRLAKEVTITTITK